MQKSVEIKNNIVTNIATGEVDGWVIVDESIVVNIGDTATQTDGEWSFTTPTPTLTKEQQLAQSQAEKEKQIQEYMYAKLKEDTTATGKTKTARDKVLAEETKIETLEREIASEQSSSE